MFRRVPGLFFGSDFCVFSGVWMADRNFRRGLMTCTAFAALALAVAPAVAQDAAPAQDSSVLKKIVVKSTAKTARQKLEKGVADTPLATETTAVEIREKEIDNIKDLGNTTEPGVDFVRGQGVFMRGLGGPRVTTLIDDVPIPYLQNTARNGNGGPNATTNSDGGTDSFDFSMLSSVDVLRGADSSRAGSGALAGALVLRTLEPEDIISEGKDWGVLSKATYDGEDNSFGGTVAAAKKVGATSVLLQGGYKRGHERDNQGTVDSIGPTRSKANPLDYYQRSLLAKVRHEIDGGHRIGLTAEHFSKDSTADLKSWRGSASGSSRGYTTRFGADDVRRDRVSLDYDYEAPAADAAIDAARLSLYWQRLVKNAGDTGYRVAAPAIGPWMRDNELTENDLGLTGSLLSQFETGTLSHEVRLSGNISFSKNENFLAGMDACVLNPALGGCSSLHSNQADMPRVDSTRLGLSLDDKIGFGDSGFSLTPGLRFDWFDYNTKLTADYIKNPGYATEGLPASTDGMRVSPKLLAAYQVAPAVELFAQWSMAYRAPTVSELYLNFSNPASGYGVLGNSSLKPETGHGFEVGANLGDEDFGGRVTLFHNLYRNFIDTQTLYGVPGYPVFLQTNINRDRVSISGLEASLQKHFDNGINLHGSVAWAYGKDTGANTPIRSVAPFKAIAGIGYERENWGTDLTGIFVGSMRNDHNAATFDAPGYGLFNLTGWWEPEQVKGLRVQAGVYNLFDKTYYDALALESVNPNTVPLASNTSQPLPFYSEAGRTFKISLTKKF